MSASKKRPTTSPKDHPFGGFNCSPADRQKRLEASKEKAKRKKDAAKGEFNKKTKPSKGGCGTADHRRRAQIEKMRQRREAAERARQENEQRRQKPPAQPPGGGFRCGTLDHMRRNKFPRRGPDSW